MTRFYAVKIGRTPGIYTSWKDCEKQIKGFDGAVYKSFTSQNEANKFMTEGTENREYSVHVDMPDTYAFTVGHYNDREKCFGFGGYLVLNGKEFTLQGRSYDVTLLNMRQGAGELVGTMNAIQEANKRGIKELTIFYDYPGIEKWITGEWSCNVEGTRSYKKLVSECSTSMSIKFVHVQEHNRLAKHDEAEHIAMRSAGIKH